MPFDNPAESEVLSEVDILDRMLKLLASPNHWCQYSLTGVASDGTQQFCMFGAAFVADHGSPSTFCSNQVARESFKHGAANRVMSWMGRQKGVPVDIWNDFMNTHWSDVYRLLQKARAHFANKV